MHDLVLRCSGSLAWALSPLFQRGVLVPVTSGTRMPDFLLGSLNIPLDRLKERVQTILLDGRPVDDLAAWAVGPGSVVALSASLPGLAGATLRRGGKYASLRSSITYTEAAREGDGSGSGFATLKLFNLLINELGPLLLQRGTLVPASLLVTLLRSGSLPGQCTRIEMDGIALDADQLRDRLAELKEEPLRLRITTRKPSRGR